MRTVREAAQAWLAEGRPAMLVEIEAVKGSVPRDAGTRMLVGLATAEGTIGGGHLELKAIEQARALLRDAPATAPAALPRTAHFALGPSLGQCCGGVVTLRFERLTAGHLRGWPSPAPRFHLQLHGAGHVGRAVAAQLALLPVDVDWLDEREDEFPASLGTPAWPPHIRRVVADAIEAEVATAPPGAFYLVLTHRHDLDLRIAEAILRRGDFGFFGLIGSRTKRQRFAHRLQAMGIAAEAVDRMACAIGLSGIAGKEPEVIAVGVVAQMLLAAGAGPAHSNHPQNPH